MSHAELLHTLTRAESDALEEMDEPGSLPAGTVIFEQSDTPDCVQLVRGGRVRVAARGAGVPLRAFRGFLMDYPRAAISLLELISRRLGEADARQISR